MDGMNVHDDDPSEDVEAKRTKRPKLSDEEEMVPAGSGGGGLSYAAVTQAENMDAESSATCGANAYQPYEDMSKTLDFSDEEMLDFSVEDDDKEFFRRQEAEAVRLLNLTKMLYSLDPVDFCRRPVEVQKELERKGLLRPHDMGAQECISLRCIKLNLVRHYDRHHNLLERLVDFAPYMPCDDETGKQVEWLKEKGHLTSLCNSHISEYNIFLALQELGVVFYNMQWSYHPLITEGHRDDFVTIIKRVAGVVRQTLKQNHEEFDGLQLSGGDFINNLVNKCKETSPGYQRVAKQVALHDEFHWYVDLCESIQHDSSIDKLLEDETVVPGQFSSLDKELVKESLNAKIYMLKKVQEVELYFTCLESLVRQKLDGRDDFDRLLFDLTKEGLFEFSDLPTDKPVRENWSPKFYELLDKARHEAFGHLPDHYVINGLLDYSFIFSLDGEHQGSKAVEDRLAGLQAFGKRKVCFLREELWRTKHYTNPIYEQFADAIKLIDLPPG